MGFNASLMMLKPKTRGALQVFPKSETTNGKIDEVPGLYVLRQFLGRFYHYNNIEYLPATISLRH